MDYYLEVIASDKTIPLPASDSMQQIAPNIKQHSIY